MNLLLLDQFSDIGGAQGCLLDLVGGIRARGWQALVAAPGEGALFNRARELGCEVERITCGPYGSGRKSAADALRFATGTPRLAREIRQLARRIGATVVYVNGPRILPGAALSRLDVPVVFHAHSYLLSGALRKLAGRSLQRMNASVIASCRFVAEPWREYVGADRITVVYNGVRGPGAGKGRRLAERAGVRPVIGCIGRIAPEKGQREFIEAALRIRRALPDASFAIYGAPLFSDRGSMRYDAEVCAAAAAASIKIHGWAPDVYAVLAELDLLLVPSAAHEATTRVILEAFAAGAPVIAFPSGGIPEVVEDGRTGLLAGSAEEMAQRAIELLTADGARRIAMVEAARESWERNFTLDRYRAGALEAVERAAARCR